MAIKSGEKKHKYVRQDREDICIYVYIDIYASRPGMHQRRRMMIGWWKERVKVVWWEKGRQTENVSFFYLFHPGQVMLLARSQV